MIYDCFPFFNELDLLEVRLRWLDNTVDKFVLSESTRTFTGKEKPLFFEINKKRFEKYLHKIEHIIVDELPPADFRPEQTFEWRLEKFQRFSINKIIEKMDVHDTILISDLDEIPDIDFIIGNYRNEKVNIFSMNEYVYFIDYKSVKKKAPKLKHRLLSPFVKKYKFNHLHAKAWFGTVMAKKSVLQDAQQFREVKDRFYKGVPYRYLENAGWHFSFMGGLDKMITKLDSYAHTEYRSEFLLDKNNLLQIIERGELFHKDDSIIKKINIAQEFPVSLFGILRDKKELFSK